MRRAGDGAVGGGGGEGDKMVVRMSEGLGLEVWDHPEERKRVVGEALARWDEGVLKEALWAYLVRRRRKPDRVAPHYVGYFVRWLALKGRRWPHLEAEDPKAFLLEAKEKGFPGGERGPLAWGTVERARASLRHLFPFLDWAGHPMPPTCASPPARSFPWWPPPGPCPRRSTPGSSGRRRSIPSPTGVPSSRSSWSSWGRWASP